MLVSKVLNFFVLGLAEINNIYLFLPTCDLSTLLNLLAVGLFVFFIFYNFFLRI